MNSLVEWLEQEERKAARLRAKTVRFLLIVACVAAPFIVLGFTGAFSLGSFARFRQELPQERKAREDLAARNALLAEAGADAAIDDPVAVDLHRYLQKDLPPLQMEEKKVLDEYWGIVNDNFTDDLTAIHAIRDRTLPQYNRYRERVETVRVATDDLYAVHALLLDVARRRQTAFERIAQAGSGDQPAGLGPNEWRVEAARQMQEALNVEAAFHLRLDELQRKHPWKLSGSHESSPAQAVHGTPTAAPSATPASFTDDGKGQ